MKNALCAAIIACALPAIAAHAEPDSAYTALRALGTSRGADTLKHVIAVEGHGGAPEPVSWRVILDDPAATGGVRDVDIAHGRVVAEHTPTRANSGAGAGPIIDFTKLNLDSAGVFTVAEKEAQKTQLSFDTIDYSLHASDAPDGGPVWVVHLMDASHHPVGNLIVAADTGNIVTSNLSGSQPPPVYNGAPQPPPTTYTTEETDHDNLYTPPAGEPTPERQADDSDTEDTHGLRIGHKIKQGFMAVGQSLKNFVSGATNH